MSSVGGPSGIGDILAMREQIVARSSALKQISAPETQTTQTTQATQTTHPDATAPLDRQQGVASFAQTLSDAAGEVSAIQKRSSDMAAAYERGEVTDISQVMLARQESGVAFEATLQVRNHLLKAYQDIMRMGG
jgi:flagellar hook-basal body complex protein FliE